VLGARARERGGEMSSKLTPAQVSQAVTTGGGPARELAAEVLEQCADLYTLPQHRAWAIERAALMILDYVVAKLREPPQKVEVRNVWPGFREPPPKPARKPAKRKQTR
jgi:hypothetical protein